MRPTDQKAEGFAFVVRSIPAVPSICGFLFALSLAFPAGASASISASWIVLLSALLSSIAGFAFSPIAGAFLFHTLKEPLAVIPILLIASIAQQTYCVWRLRDKIRSHQFGPYLSGSLATLPAGLFLLLQTPASAYLPVLGLLLVSYGTFSALRPSLRPRSNPLWGQVAVGALGGITGGLAAFPAAFVTMWCHLQGFDKIRARSIIQPFILINQLLSLTALTILRPAHAVSLASLRYAAPAILGAYVGLMIFNRIEVTTFNRLVGLFLVAAGLSFVSPI